MPVSVARFLGADSWCKDNDPFCGFTMGTPVTSGCSRATRPGSKVYVECVNRNPLHNPTHTTGQMINCAIFDKKVKQFLGEAVIKNSSSARS